MAKITREAIEARLRFLRFCRATPTKIIPGKKATLFLIQEQIRVETTIEFNSLGKRFGAKVETEVFSEPEPRISRIMVDATYIDKDMPIWSDDAFFLMQKDILVRLGRHKYHNHDLPMNTYMIREGLTKDEFEDLWFMLEKAKKQGAYL